MRRLLRNQYLELKSKKIGNLSLFKFINLLILTYPQVEQQEILRREEELKATVRLPAEAEAYRLQAIAEGKR